MNVYHGQLNVSYSVLADDALFGRQTSFHQIQNISTAGTARQIMMYA